MIRGMSHPTRWARVAAVAAAASLALFAGAGTGYAGPTPNAPTPLAIGDKATASTEGGSFIFGRLDGQNERFHTGLITLTFEDHSRLLTYCIDLKNPLSRLQPYVETEWSATGIGTGDRAKLLWILGHSQPNVPDAAVLAAAGVVGGDSLPKVNEVVYAGTQAAIWHFSDGMTLLPRDAAHTDFSAAQYDAIQKLYDFLTSPANTGQNGAPTLAITPPTATGLVGDLLGPFTVTTSAPTVTLTATGGATLLAKDKTTPVTSLGNGDEFFVKLGQAGSATVTGTGQGFVALGRAFVLSTPSDASVRPLTGSEAAQKLIAAQLTPQQVSARVAVRATTPVPTPTPTPTPTVAPTSPPLAATGASPMPKVGVAVLLLVVGTGLTLAARRRRGGNHA